MIAKISNQDFGYSVTCDGYWAAVGNPNPFRYDLLTESLIRTGSIEVYKYNINTDYHDLKKVIYRPLTPVEKILLTTEQNNSESIAPAGITGPYWYLHTEYTGSVPITADMDLLVDVGQYYSSSEDGYGYEVDMRDTILAVGCPYFTSRFTFDTQSIFYTNNGYVDLFDLSTLDIDPYSTRTPPSIIGTSSVGGFIEVYANVLSGQNYTSIIFQISGSENSNWQNVAMSQTSNDGGNITLKTNYTISEFNSLYSYRVIGVVGTDPYLMSLYNPNPLLESGSFGYSISINDEWLAVGSPLESGSRGSVFMFRKYNEDNLSWSFYQTLQLPSDISPSDNFGKSIGLNKATSSYSWSMVVGSNKLSHSKAYVYEFDGTNWNNTSILNPDSSSIYPLPFYPTLPIVVNYPNIYDLFGYSVSMFKDTIIVGAPKDRIIQEYSGSSLYQQGAVYFFERCSTGSSKFYLNRKSYGNEKIMKNNLLGWSVDIHDQYTIAGAPKINCLSSSICYLRGSLFQEHFCENELESELNGQFILYNEITSSIPSNTNIDWDIVNTYQVKKRFLSPYRVYGWDTSICSQFITIGSPMLISGSNSNMDLNSLTGSFVDNINDIGDLNGKAYIYNLKNLHPNFYIGNVFYRNGKIVVMTSGSNFEGLLLNDVVDNEYKYDIEFKSKQTVFEKQVVCPIDIGEFNVSTNPTSVVLSSAIFDINHNGQFDFQDTDVLLRYMAYKNTEQSGNPNTDWSSSIINTVTDEEITVYNMYYNQYTGTDELFTSNYSMINNTLYSSLDFNNDNKIDYNDMSILWKYFIYRLTQKNYQSYITPSSKNKFLSDIIDYLNSKTLRGYVPKINQNFLDYSLLSKQDPTGSYLAPTVTSIGLYSGCDLVCIAKLGSPIKITPDFPINFVVKMDF